MMRKMNRMMFYVSVLLCVSLVFSACSSNSTSGSNSSSSSNSSESSANKESAASYGDLLEKKLKLTIWSAATGGLDKTLGPYLTKKFPNWTFEFSNAKLQEFITVGGSIDLFVESIGSIPADIEESAIQSDLTDLLKKHQVDLSKLRAAAGHLLLTCHSPHTNTVVSNCWRLFAIGSLEWNIPF